MSTTRLHRMPFGAEIGAAGVRFRLWAPGASAVELLLCDGDAQRVFAMPGTADGWYELVTGAAGAGSRYRFRIDGATEVPDPAARASDAGRNASIVCDPRSYHWRNTHWRGRPWHEAVVYELHIGTFTPQGTFAALHSRLPHLAALGVTVIELMPVADFPGDRGWGYDGVLPYAPDGAYGTPEELKAFVDAAHEAGLAVMLDVVYNHFGPEGNWLHAYAPQFFSRRHATPWGDAINFDGKHCQPVRDFFIHNALYWLEEFQFDGLRLDAVHAMHDDSQVHFIEELVRRVRDGPGRSRPVHLVLENNANTAALLGPAGTPDRADAQWNDDFHHCLHVILSGERDGYYADYSDRPHALLARCLAEGFAYQGEPSPYHDNQPRGQRSGHLPPTAFVNFLQNHDQIGNRAFGERLATLVDDEAALVAALAVLLLSPSPPMLFMGEEWAAPEPFTYFCDFGPQLAEQVRAGRKREFAAFSRFANGDLLDAIPDPTDPATLARVRLDWHRLTEPSHARWLECYRALLLLRVRHITPLIPLLGRGRVLATPSAQLVAVAWQAADGRRLQVVANLSGQSAPALEQAPGQIIYATPRPDDPAAPPATLGPWSVRWSVEEPGN